jgi:hypothetical protein
MVTTLGPGVEADTFWAVDGGVADEGVLPAAEGVVGHRDGDVDADLDASLESAGGFAEAVKRAVPLP